MDTHKAR